MSVLEIIEEMGGEDVDTLSESISPA